MKRASVIAAVVSMLIAGPVCAETQSYWGEVSFSSDLQPPDTITLPSFDTTELCPEDLPRVLQSVLVEFTYGGSADIAVDNDDEFQGTDANARIIRTWSATGPDVSEVGAKTLTSAPETLTADNGDGNAWDPTAPDGHAFTTLSFAGEDGGSDNPDKSLYETAGPGTVDFDVTPVNMVNDLQFTVTPDEYQSEVQNPLMTVRVDLTYEYACVPEPGTLLLAVFGAAVLGMVRLRRRR